MAADPGRGANRRRSDGTAITRATPATVTARSVRVIQRGSGRRPSSRGSGSARSCSPTGCSCS